jgi:CheY-like chemotaxis protein
MLTTVYVKVVGFRDTERHALNTAFRLSQDLATAYAFWTPDSPRPPQLLLLDADSYEGGLELASPTLNRKLKLIAVGHKGPDWAWRCFDRPLNWTAIIHSMDLLFAGSGGTDIDLETGEVAQGIGPPGVRQTLLVDVSRERRMYLRARLALAGLLNISEAEDAASAVTLASERHFALVVLHLDAEQLDGWSLVERLVALEPAIGSIILTSHNGTWMLQEQAEQAGCLGVLDLPFDPAQIVEMLRKV